MCRVKLVSVPAECDAAVQIGRLVAVVDEDDEAAPQAPRDVANPLDGAQVDLRAPARLELDVQAIEVLGECRRRQRALR